MLRESMITTTRGLDRQTPPMRLYEKAKKFGIWNPADLDFSQDVLDWNNLADEEREILLRLTALFQAGEEAVTLDLLPLIMAIAKEGRLEEEMFLTTFLFEEAKHVDFFNRFFFQSNWTAGWINLPKNNTIQSQQHFAKHNFFFAEWDLSMGLLFYFRTVNGCDTCPDWH